MSKLDPVQIAALEFARGKRGVGYYMEMGTGKTLTTLEEFRQLVQNREVTRLVVITPNSFKPGWTDEILKHGLTFQPFIYVSGSKHNDAWFSTIKYSAPPVLIINYEAVRIPTVLLRVMAWMRVKPTMLALDESIQIKTHNSEQTKAALKLANEAKIVRCLSGLPQTQGPHDLYPQLRSLGLFQGVKFWSFRNTFCQMGGWENKQVVGVKNADTLARIMAPIIFQARKAEWLPDLPRKDFSIRTYEMSGEQAAQYKQMRDEFLLELEDEVVAVDIAVSKYEKLSQIQCGFILNEDGNPRVLVEPEKNPRLAVLLDLLSQIEGKTIVIYRHRHTFEILSAALKDHLPAYIKGQMKPDETTEQKRRFNEDSECRLMLGQCDAIRYGHTLVSDQGSRTNRCCTMVFFESSYSLDTRTQDEDRIHRRGQKAENCLYIDLCGSDLDRRVVRALQKKQNLYDAVFSKLKTAEPVE